MKLFKFLHYDFRYGFEQNWLKLVGLVMLALISCIDFYLRKEAAYFLFGEIPFGTWADYLFYLWGGIKEYIPSPENSFLFPARWLLLYLLLCYSTLHFPYHDLVSLGGQFLPRGGSRLLWWVSKIIWNIGMTVVSWGLLLLTPLLFCWIAKEPISSSITPEFINQLMEGAASFDTFSPKLSTLLIVFPLLFAISISLLQMMLSLFLKPLFSFSIIAVILLASTYLVTPFLPGNYAMIVRSAYVVKHGMSAQGGIWVMMIMSVAAILIACIRFKRYDILALET